MTTIQARELAKAEMARYLTIGVDLMQQKIIEKAHTFESFVKEKYKKNAHLIFQTMALSGTPIGGSHVRSTHSSK